MVAKKIRDIYGNWVWEDDEDKSNAPEKAPANKTKEDENSVKLEFKDFLALTLASLQTVLLPIIVMIVLLVVVALILVH